MSDKPAANDPRRQRLAEALRENLKRRKAQRRGRADQTAEEDEPTPGNGSGRTADLS